MTEISFDEWKKFDFRVAEIIDVDDHPQADKLFVLKVDLGKEERTLVAGLKGFYEKDELVGKKVIVFVNLEPAELRGVMSEGMVLAAIQGNDDKVVLLSPEQDIENGAKVQ
jgi:methionyl-tRNA synthetase